MRSMHGLLAVALAGLLAAGCGGGSGSDGDDAPDTTPPPETPSTSTSPDLESQVEDAYLAYWDMTTRLQQAPDPDDPEIYERATGSAADEIVDGLTTLRDQNQMVAFGPQYAHEVVSVDVGSDRAVVRDCFVDDATTIDSSTGEHVSGGLASGVFVATLQEVEGAWRVSELELDEAQEGVGGCATD